jgi:hypothetical protein
MDTIANFDTADGDPYNHMAALRSTIDHVPGHKESTGIIGSIVFAYGTLMRPDVLNKVLERPYTNPLVRAYVQGFSKFQHPALPYPVLSNYKLIGVPDPDNFDAGDDERNPPHSWAPESLPLTAVVHGVLLYGLGGYDMLCLDRYEQCSTVSDDENALYHRQATIAYPMGGLGIPAFVYIPTANLAGALKQEFMVTSRPYEGPAPNGIG